ncbi:TauD/TfdA dioxygenase family protein [Phytohabitans rumicis]|uniref:Paerucumarin biosynthesis protein PvcB n=1 Tax=Phytohabitans rumicis TaxID=1076125 RepID=A0A6V8L1N5_9ACTN|nr:TauD/TfdA family dioxygenase [Phytohabitans rumicis]GFJ88539.1 paerucumarin biosynthesis protein PvcB [Phytohabitans rumicis]
MRPPPPSLLDHVELRPQAPFGLLVEARTGDARLDELPAKLLLDKAREHRLLLLRGFVPFADARQLTAFGEYLGDVPIWSFGPILELVEHEHPADGVFGNNWLPFHWDGMFLDRIPEFQVFQCIYAPGDGQGGRTVFSDTTLVLADLPADSRSVWEATEVVYTVAKKAHYGGLVRSPLVVPHPDRSFPTLRYHEPVPAEMAYPNPVTLRYEGIRPDEVPRVEQTVREALYHPRHAYTHDWHTGDVVIADNYTLLHARESYTRHCNRHLRRVHVMGDPPLTNPALPRP